MHIVICGGGTAGWMTAAALAQVFIRSGADVTVVESDEIGTVGVGEATIPPLLSFLAKLGIDEAEFLHATKGTYKLGIEFVNWGAIGERYMHPFGSHGIDWQDIRFQHYWLKAKGGASAASVDPFETYSINACAAKLNRFSHPSRNPDTVLSSLKYAFHFDAGLFARFLRSYAEARGVKRLEGKIADVKLTDAGDISAVELDGSRTIPGDLFIDCTGFRALLIEGALKTGFEDWSRWLPNDSAFAVPSAPASVVTPYTRSTADVAGWRWRIPLQHRTGNGHVYASAFLSDQDASDRLMAGLDTEPLDTPRPLRFRTGRRKLFWNRNCVAIGLSAGFIEPLESTSIHLIQTGIAKLLALLPSKFEPFAERRTYNSLTIKEYEQARDFIILHYKATRRDDSPYWRYLQDMAIPDTLEHKIDLFKARGTVVRFSEELFSEDSWLAVLLGQGLMPMSYDPVLDGLPAADVDGLVTRIGRIVAKEADAMPSYAAYMAARSTS